MRTARSSRPWGGGSSASVYAGIPPQVWAGDPHGCGPGDPHPWVCCLDTLQARPLNFFPGCGSGDPPSHTPQAPPWVWAWKPARHAGIHPPRDLQGMLGYHPPCGQTDTCKNITSFAGGKQVWLGLSSRVKVPRKNTVSVAGPVSGAEEGGGRARNMKSM